LILSIRPAGWSLRRSGGDQGVALGRLGVAQAEKREDGVRDRTFEGEPSVPAADALARWTDISAVLIEMATLYRSLH